MGTVICPFATRELERIKENHATLASTGCTKDFCQGGRIIHTDEPRIGENRTISSVEQEAEGFLRELHLEGFYKSEEVFQERLQNALYEIRGGAVEGVIRETKERGVIGGNWTQTPAEIEFGIRRAWRNSRKCIMRSHCEDLKLCDLRSVTSSAKMAIELVKALSKAFNDGNILPTVFLFPPRTPNNRGPMIWNDQLLTFAGYEQEDGSILGDPKNKQFTKEVIELGWVPPRTRTRFDLLPVVVMAEGDLPVMVELPANLRRLIEIRHPQYPEEFEQLDLKWSAFPALSRLGFDIGGVQYTATPFIGWFMDAEIGVRNLADSFRYNVLPDVVKALRLADGAMVDVDSFEDLPEFEKLAMLSRAQTELNYAVQHSYIREKVTMSDSLTASIKFSRYDDEYQKKHGFRLPSDPFWVAPPQGSIVPIWHRGAAPNYQPKPMICRHVQDPAKAWRREKSSWPLGVAQLIDSPQIRSAWASSTTLSPQVNGGEAKRLDVLSRVSSPPDVLPLSASKKPLAQSSVPIIPEPKEIEFPVTHTRREYPVSPPRAIQRKPSSILNGNITILRASSSTHQSSTPFAASSPGKPDPITQSEDTLIPRTPERQIKPSTFSPIRGPPSPKEVDPLIAPSTVLNGRGISVLESPEATKVNASSPLGFNKPEPSANPFILPSRKDVSPPKTPDFKPLVVSNIRNSPTPTQGKSSTTPPSESVFTSKPPVVSPKPSLAPVVKDTPRPKPPVILPKPAFTPIVKDVFSPKPPAPSIVKDASVYKPPIPQNKPLTIPNGGNASINKPPPPPPPQPKANGTSLPKPSEPQTKQLLNGSPTTIKSNGKSASSSVAIYYCSAGTIAEKLAIKLQDKTKILAKTTPHISLGASVAPLDDLEASEMTADKVFLFVISTTGTGDIPANGTDFSDMCEEIVKTGKFEGSKGFKYAIFGNGDTRYTTSFNFAAFKIDKQLKEVGGVPLTGGPYEADTAVQSPPWSALNKWWAEVKEKI